MPWNCRCSSLAHSAEHEFGDQLRQWDSALGMGDLSSGWNERLAAAGLENDDHAAKKRFAHHLGIGVAGQFYSRRDTHAHDSLVGLGVEFHVGHGTDLHSAQRDIGATL